MSLTFPERLAVPAALTLFVFLASGGTVAALGSASSGMRIFVRCATAVTAGLTCSMAWHDVLEHLTGWRDAWIAAAALWSAGVTYSGWRRYAKAQEEYYARLSKGGDH